MTRLSLVILALEFTALGLISLMKQPDCTISVLSADKAYPFIGSTFSILVGTVFLIAAFSLRRGLGSERLISEIDADLE